MFDERGVMGNGWRPRTPDRAKTPTAVTVLAVLALGTFCFAMQFAAFVVNLSLARWMGLL